MNIYINNTLLTILLYRLDFIPRQKHKGEVWGLKKILLVPRCYKPNTIELF
jgi:hypothetical protein